jgi:DNA-binding NarL/FixJ family response regulator
MIKTTVEFCEQTMNNDLSALIVARPGHRRDSLRALLKVIPQLEIINQADDGVTALNIVNGQQPTLMLLDSTLSDDEVRLVLEQVECRPAHAFCLVLTETNERQKMARAVYADETMPADFAITDFLATTTRLLSPQRETNERLS